MPRLQEVPEQLRHGLVSIAFAESVGFRRQRVYTRLGEILEEVRMQLGAADAALLGRSKPFRSGSALHQHTRDAQSNPTRG